MERSRVTQSNYSDRCLLTKVFSDHSGFTEYFFSIPFVNPILIINFIQWRRYVIKTRQHRASIGIIFMIQTKIMTVRKSFVYSLFHAIQNTEMARALHCGWVSAPRIWGSLKSRSVHRPRSKELFCESRVKDQEKVRGWKLGSEVSLRIVNHFAHWLAPGINEIVSWTERIRDVRKRSMKTGRSSAWEKQGRTCH